MRILFVTSYPPPFDARTRAATEHVRALREAGNEVEVVSPTPSAAHHHHDVFSWRAVGPMVALVRRFERVVVDDALASVPPLRAALRAARSVETWRGPDGIEPAPRHLDPSGPVRPEAWPSERDAAMAEIRARAAHRGAGAAGDLSAPLRRVPPLTLPAAASLRPGAGIAKRVVRRLTAWQVDPIVERMNQLRATLIEVLEHAEQRDER